MIDQSKRDSLTTEWAIGNSHYGIDLSDGVSLVFRHRKGKDKQWALGCEDEHLKMLTTILNLSREAGNFYSLPVHPDHQRR